MMDDGRTASAFFQPGRFGAPVDGNGSQLAAKPDRSLRPRNSGGAAMDPRDDSLGRGRDLLLRVGRDFSGRDRRVADAGTLPVVGAHRFFPLLFSAGR